MMMMMMLNLQFGNPFTALYIYPIQLREHPRASWRIRRLDRYPSYQLWGLGDQVSIRETQAGAGGEETSGLAS